MAKMHQAGSHLDYTPAGAAVTAGQVVNLGPGYVGVAANDIDEDRLGSLTVAGIHIIANSGVAFTVGATVGYNSTNDTAVAGGGGNFNIGTAAYAAAATAGDDVYVMLNDRNI